MEQHKTLYPEIRPENVAIPKGKSLGDWLNTRIARYETRSTRLGRAQVPGRLRSEVSPRADCAISAPAAPASPPTTTPCPAEHFTFSTMMLPAGCEGPLHLHTDAEEVFFMLRGNKVRFIIEHQGERFETVLKERDLFSVPPGVYRGLVNEGIEEALMCVMIGNNKPVTPTYPPDHPVAKIKRPKGGGAG